MTGSPTPGDDLVLTLDRSIQFAAEQALLQRVDRAGRQARARSIVMDTDTGDVWRWPR